MPTIIAGLLETCWLDEYATRILLDLGDEVLGPALALKKALLHDPGSVTRIAVATLAELVHRTPAADAVLGVEEEIDKGQRVNVARALGRVGKGHIEVAQALRDCAEWWDQFGGLDSRFGCDGIDSREAVLALGQVWPGTSLAVPALIEILTEYSLLRDRRWPGALHG